MVIFELLRIVLADSKWYIQCIKRY